eukprot:TRINITY_DN30354_c0_g1_i1.p1 TRINITY_DN30354_c0_g1~~TRINITY_DN30354_c0_g1_i1.p1  ORF type:complete len:909 (-),score=96.62 TRINITY_DN30354_c0_g1_i1:280-2952(-)
MSEHTEALSDVATVSPGKGEAFVRKLVSMRFCVIGCWLAAVAISAPFALQLVDAARFSFEPVRGTDSYAAQERINEEFPQLSFQDIEVVLLSCSACPSQSGGVIDNRSAVGNFTYYAMRTLDAMLHKISQNHPEFHIQATSALDVADSALHALSAKNPLLSEDNRTALFQFSWQVLPANQHDALAAFQEFSDLVDGLQAEAAQQLEDYSLALTGPLAMFKSTLEHTKSDLKQKDLFVLPVALLILGLRVRSWRLTLLTLTNVGMSAGISFSLFLPVAKYAIDISPLVPSVMVFLSIALSIDYSLFLFTRFSEEVRRGKQVFDALVPMLVYSGEVVCLSGSVLILCYLGVLFFPGKGISSIGLGASLSIFMAMLSNLTLSPCVIAAFPTFFTAGLEPGTTGHCRQICGTGNRQQRLWFWWGQKVTALPCMVLVPLIAYCAMGPLCWQLVHYRANFDNSLMFPVDGSATETYERILHMSSPGQLLPVFILQSGDVKSNDWFKRNADLAMGILLATAGQPFELKAADMLGVSTFPNPLDPSVPFSLTWNESQGSLPTAEKLLETDVRIGDVDISAAYRMLWKQLAGKTNRTAMLRIQPSFDPYGPHMQPFISCLRAELARHKSLHSAQILSSTLPMASDVSELVIDDAIKKESNLAEDNDDILLYSQLIIVFDLMNIIYERMPYILIAVFSICFLCIGLVFKSAFVPFKLCFTVLVPLCMVYGVAILVYQDGILDFMGVQALHGTGGIYWAQPVFTVTILTGLALDYDIFLFARVVELRMQGFTNSAAIAGAMALTGPTITAAGLIMACAFGGLLLTDIPANNQIGFLMSFAVLMDTFVIRSCLVPAILMLASKLNYWPRRLPAETLKMEDMTRMLNFESDARGHMTIAPEPI